MIKLDNAFLIFGNINNLNFLKPNTINSNAMPLFWYHKAFTYTQIMILSCSNTIKNKGINMLKYKVQYSFSDYILKNFKCFNSALKLF